SLDAGLGVCAVGNRSADASQHTSYRSWRPGDRALCFRFGFDGAGRAPTIIRHATHVTDALLAASAPSKPSTVREVVRRRSSRLSRLPTNPWASDIDRDGRR